MEQIKTPTTKQNVNVHLLPITKSVHLLSITEQETGQVLSCAIAAVALLSAEVSFT